MFDQAPGHAGFCWMLWDLRSKGAICKFQGKDVKGSC